MREHLRILYFVLSCTISKETPTVNMFFMIPRVDGFVRFQIEIIIITESLQCIINEKTLNAKMFTLYFVGFAFQQQCCHHRYF